MAQHAIVTDTLDEDSSRFFGLAREYARTLCLPAQERPQPTATVLHGPLRKGTRTLRLYFADGSMTEHPVASA